MWRDVCAVAVVLAASKRHTYAKVLFGYGVI
jgi:hypothetical protein